jgi:sporulation integral membrane protein YlbJ
MRNQGFTGIYLIAFLTIAISILFMLFPQQGFEAALRGVSIWWDILFPALFPFFVISELLLGFGIVHFLGTLLDPMMRPVFRIPGIGGFVMAMGFASGYPVGARLTSKLWEQQLVDRDEGERLVAFTSSSDPIFLIGAVSIGFFHDVSIALVLAIAHYGGAVMIGLLMRFHGSPSVQLPHQFQTKGRIWERAFLSMHTARIKDGRPIGVLLNQAVHSSLGLSFVVGGLVVFFSVVLEVLTAGHVMGFLYMLVQTVLQLTGLPASLAEAVIKGIFEVTLGAKAAGAAGDNIPLVNKTAIAAFILSWAGLSVHAQIVSLLSNTNMRYFPFITARFVHGIVSALLVVLLWQPLQPLRRELSVFMPNYDSHTSLSNYLQWIMPTSALLFISTFLMIAVLYIVYSFLKMMHKILSRSL